MKQQKFTQQDQINKLLQQSNDIPQFSTSSALNNRKQVVKDQQQSYSYDDQFQSYSQSKNTFQNSQNKPKEFPDAKNEKKSNKVIELEQIRQEQSPVRGFMDNKNKKSTDHNKTLKDFKKSQQKMHIPYNYCRLKEREKQLLFTTITEDNKRLKYQLAQKDKDFEKQKAKNIKLLEQRAKQSSSVRQKILEKELQTLKNRVEKLQNIIKHKDEVSKVSITRLSKTQQKFISYEQHQQRQHELISIIDKLKERLLNSDEQLKVVQQKMNEGLNFNDELHRKLKRVEQLQYKIEKMTSLAQSDRQYIQNLKDNIKQLEKVLDQQKKRAMRIQIENKRQQLASLTNNDLMKQLKETKRQKQQLEKSLKDLSSVMMAKVKGKISQDFIKNHPKFQVLEDSNQILRT